jgi:hypothetical protein
MVYSIFQSIGWIPCCSRILFVLEKCLQPKNAPFDKGVLAEQMVAQILPTFSDIEMVRQVKLLGVLISDTLSFESYVNALLSSCSQRFYLLKILRDGGMPIRQLNVVYSALIIGRIFYCFSAWGGFLNSEQAGRINALLKRAVKYRFTDTIYDFDGMLLHADCKLFKNIQCENHSLNHCLPASSTNDICQRLRKRRHNYVLPLCHYQLYRNSFFARCLYAFL